MMKKKMRVIVALMATIVLLSTTVQTALASTYNADPALSTVTYDGAVYMDIEPGYVLEDYAYKDWSGNWVPVNSGMPNSSGECWPRQHNETIQNVRIVKYYRGNGGEPAFQVEGLSGSYFLDSISFLPTPVVKYYNVSPAQGTQNLTYNVGQGNVEVELLNDSGNVVQTKTADASGNVTFTVTGYYYNPEAAIRFAEQHWNDGEIVNQNDCATFVSNCLTNGGFACAACYASGAPSHGSYADLWDYLSIHGWTEKRNVVWSDVKPGDVVFPNSDRGHAMIVAEVTSAGVHLYAHSTSAKNIQGQSDNCWTTMIFPYVYHFPGYTWRIKQAEKGSLEVLKVDADNTNAKLNGAVFELYDSSNTLVGTKTTGTDGKAVFTDLTPGNYTIKEKSAPSGYLLNNP
jgi:hypothetical protein